MKAISSADANRHFSAVLRDVSAVALGKLLLLVQGLGLTMEMTGWPSVVQVQGISSGRFGQPSVVLGPPPEDSAP